jgi:hypothetical protein
MANTLDHDVKQIHIPDPGTYNFVRSATGMAKFGDIQITATAVIKMNFRRIFKIHFSTLLSFRVLYMAYFVNKRCVFLIYTYSKIYVIISEKE